MKEGYWGYWLILLGIFIIVILMLVQSYTTTNTQDYYLIKEVTNSAMIDAIDTAYYRNSGGKIRINKEKFVENFLRRFSETVNINTTYTVEFYDIFESPPKVTVKVSSKSNTFMINGEAGSFESVNKATAILEQR